MSLGLIALQFRYTHAVLTQNLEGFTEDDAFAAPAGGGNCANWIVGHLLNSRAELLSALDAEAPWGDRRLARYRRGSAQLSGAKGALPLTELLEDLNATQNTLLAAFKAFDESRLRDPAPFSPTENPKETVGSLFAGLAFHESYHAGQTGLLRRMVGKEGKIR